MARKFTWVVILAAAGFAIAAQLRGPATVESVAAVPLTAAPAPKPAAPAAMTGAPVAPSVLAPVPRPVLARPNLSEKERDPEANADPGLKAKRDSEEEEIRRLRNPGIIPEPN